MVGDKCVKDDSGNLSFDSEAKKVAWKQHYEQLLNEEFSWNPEDLTADPVVGPPIHIDVEMVVKAITKMKTGKAAGPSGIVAEMLKASGDTGARLVADLANDILRNGVIPSDWEDSFIINIYKGKGDALERGNYRGLKLSIDGRPHNEWFLMQDKKLDVVDSFCYLGDTIGAGGGCDLSVITRIRSAWCKFRELLPISTSRGQIYSTYIRTVLPVSVGPPMSMTCLNCNVMIKQ